MTEQFDDRKARASAWFRQLRDDIVAAFEGLEDTQTTGPFADQPAGRFEVSETRRDADDGIGRGRRVDERDARRPRVRKGRRQRLDRLRHTWRSARKRRWPRAAFPAWTDDPRFWASGISLVAHMQNPHTPGGAHEHPHVLDAGCLVVRRRVGPEPLHRIRRGYRVLSRRPETALRPARPGLLSRASRPGRTSTSSSRTGAARAASAASSTTI